MGSGYAVNPEWAGAIIAIIGFIGTVFNVWLTAKMRADLAEIKLWGRETFVAKVDVPLYLSGYQRDAQTIRDSADRLRTAT